MSVEVVLGEDRFRRRADGDWEMLTPTPDVTITFGSTEATERRWRQLAQALDEIAAERAEVELLRAALANAAKSIVWLREGQRPGGPS